jgi:D-threonate/D-erythronate kinase
MPPADEAGKWFQKVHEIISQQKRCIIAVKENTAATSPLALRKQMAQLIKIIIEKENIRELFIEGGSTAAAVLTELNIKSLIPENELMRGVTRMKAGDLHVTVKPGSYALPSEIMS